MSKFTTIEKLGLSITELCDLYKQECLDNWHSPGLYLKPDFNKGFDSACALLIPEIEKLHNMLWETRNDMVLIHNLLLDYYSEENVYFHNPEYAFNKAKESLDRLKALKSWQEFLK